MSLRLKPQKSPDNGRDEHVAVAGRFREDDTEPAERFDDVLTTVG